MSRTLTSLIVATVLAIGLWWFAKDNNEAKVKTGVFSSGPTASSEVETDPSALPVAQINPDPNSAPNTATAQWLADIQRPGLLAQPLPYPLDVTLSRAAARALYRKSQEVSDCYFARSGLDTESWEEWTGTAWLEAAERERVRVALRQSMARQLDNCRRHGLRENEDESKVPEAIPPGFVRWARTSAAASGDPAARAAHFRFTVRRKPDVDTEIRPLLRELLLADPVDLPAMSALHERYGPQLGELLQVERANGYQSNVDLEALWLLVACDRGLECGETSDAADRLCLMSGLCGYPNVEAAVRDGLIASPQLQPTMQTRQRIVAALRRGDIDAFVVHKPPPPPARRKPSLP